MAATGDSHDGFAQENQRLAALQVAAAAEEAARVKAVQQAQIAQKAARQAAPGALHGYLNTMSSKDPDNGPSSATLATTYAPLILSSLTLGRLMGVP